MRGVKPAAGGRHLRSFHHNDLISRGQKAAPLNMIHEIVGKIFCVEKPLVPEAFEILDVMQDDVF
jgi:hypothetical protein